MPSSRRRRSACRHHRRPRRQRCQTCQTRLTPVQNDNFVPSRTFRGKYTDPRGSATLPKFASFERGVRSRDDHRVEPAIRRRVRQLRGRSRDRLDTARHAERPARPPVEVPVELPPTDEPVQRGADVPADHLAAAQRQLIDAVELPDVRSILIGNHRQRFDVLRVQELVLLHSPREGVRAGERQAA